MAAKSPFVTVKATCPVCNEESQYRYLKSRLVKVARFDRDNFPLQYQWEDPGMAHIIPHHFYYWCCPGCYYVAPEPDFRGEAVKSRKFSLFRDKLLAARDHPVLRVLSAAAKENLAVRTAHDAAPIILLGIWQHELLTQNMRDMGRLSRLCLRLSWLYREFQKSPEPLLDPSLQKALKEAWPDLPASRREAVRKAKTYYGTELDQHVPKDDLKRRLTLMFLLAEFDVILGYVREALPQASAIMQLAVTERNRIHAFIHGDRVLSNKQYDVLNDRSRFLRNCVEDIKDFFDRTVELLVRLDKPKALKIVEANEGLTREKTAELLHKNGFHRKVIDSVLEEMK